MTVFWIITGAGGLAVTALLVLALLHGRRSVDATAFDIAVYRDQLKEVDRDLARGTIAPEEAERLKTEVSRRLLAADAAAGTESSSRAGRGPTLAAALLVASLILGGGYGLYAQLGAPGYGDLSLATRIELAEDARRTRPSQAMAEEQVPATQPAQQPSEEYLDLVQKLRGAVAERPDDLQGYTLLARSEAALGNFVAAYEAQERIVELKGDAATGKDYADLADMMVLAAGGYVSPEAEGVLERTLARDPENGVARYYAGLTMAQTGRPDRAFRMWDALLRRSAPEDPWVPPIAGQIEDMAARAGVTDYTPPIPRAPALPGPGAADVEAAQDMTPEARQEMIRGMVARLSDRLATEGGTPEEWARLIGALVVIGDPQQAIAVYADAQEVFAGNDDALATVREAAQGAGIGQ
ncbi:c-type cytochrome biogenesis protein CcmI [Litorisediminicola beolgyonensis]|uniref:C-type cytochrome biogenesis protein CcmI n=1 Tax=Litorisediminicola beolgyonensis TaxID=1173614 RepID=A0ABW3ZJ09_9RHOB